MLPIDFLCLTVRPVVDIRLRCKSQGLDYPPDVPLNITRVIELDIVSNLERKYSHPDFLATFVFVVLQTLKLRSPSIYEYADQMEA